MPLVNRSLSVSALAAALLLAGCGGAGEDGSAVVLTEAQAEQAVLSPENLGAGYEADPAAESESEEGEEDFGCISDIASDIETDAAVEAEAAYVSTGDLGVPEISSSVSSFESASEVSDRFEELRAALEGCDRVEVSGDDVALDLALEVDTDEAADAVDEQVNLTAVGMASAEGMELPVAMEVAAARVDNHVVFLTYFDFDDQATGAIDAYTTAAVERLVAVLDDEEPSDEEVAP